MAYQTRHRDPLLDSRTQEAIERRGRELLGIVLVALAAVTAAILASYSPQDPSFFSATDAPVQNMLGRFGASVAASLSIVLGFGSWVLAFIVASWGLRLMFHAGGEQALSRMVFAPIAVAVAAVFASTIAPPGDWGHSFGLGGLFGDTVLGAMLNFLPISASFGVRLLSLPILGFALGLMLYAAGFTKEELRRIGHFLLVGVILLYDGLMRTFGAGLNGASAAARGVAEKGAERRVRRKEARLAAVEEDDVLFDDADVAPEPEAPRPAGGLLAGVSTLMRRMPEPELVEPAREAELAEALDEVESPGEDRIRARIADAIRLRARGGPRHVQANVGRAEPPVMRRLKPEPLLLKVPGAVPPAPMAEIDDEPSAPMPALREAYDAGPDYTLDAEEDYAGEPVAAVAGGHNGLQVAPRIQPRMAPLSVEEPRSMVQHPAQGAPRPSRQARAEAQPALALEPQAAPVYEHPPLSLLTSPTSIQRHVLSDEALEENARMLENVLDDYGVKGEIVSVRPGPVVTMYELEPAPGLKASRVIGLADDIARSMSALSARVSTVPGRSVIGIELPNANREKVVLREILSAREFGDSSMPLPLALGKDIAGAPVVSNLAKMPHLLIAGTTGSGKSVAINTMILSLLYRRSPEECRMIMIDPKMLELSVYDGIPHLLSPVVTDPKKAVVAHNGVVGEMEDRYRKRSKLGVRNLEGYNGRVRDAMAKD
ncbi:MAG: DNA translocase FtsK 4TM domain-containing protein, partial [Tropicimonas sp.]|uniref:DNA translocase FtsK n=1 Tax=Tropicimonas sp. TaxID=2067044 RepID=UPI003A884F96